jgi:hypothetical protein
VLIDESAAILAGVDTIAEPRTFGDLAVRFVAPVHRPDSEYFAARVGYFVGLEHDGKVTVVAINEDGESIGRAELTGIDPRSLGL